jgi:hypothetical protein
MPIELESSDVASYKKCFIMRSGSLPTGGQNRPGRSWVSDNIAAIGTAKCLLRSRIMTDRKPLHICLRFPRIDVGSCSWAYVAEAVTAADPN